MIQTEFGRLKRRVSRLGFGAWAIGSVGYGPVERGHALAALETYVNSGGNFIDTARIYGNSEDLVGGFVKAHGARKELFVCSKSKSVVEEAIKQDLEETLVRLRAGYLDLYYLHEPPENLEEMNRVLEIFENLRRQGLIKGIGASIKGPNVTSLTQELCLQYIHSGRVDAIQLIFSVFRQRNRTVFQAAEAAGVAVVARTALENGFLTGKYPPGHRFGEKDHRGRWDGPRVDEILSEVARLKASAVTAHFENLADLAIRFAYDEPLVTTILVGARDEGQVQSNLRTVFSAGLPHGWRDGLVRRYETNETLGNI